MDEVLDVSQAQREEAGLQDVVGLPAVELQQAVSSFGVDGERAGEEAVDGVDALLQVVELVVGDGHFVAEERDGEVGEGLDEHDDNVI